MPVWRSNNSTEFDRFYPWTGRLTCLEHALSCDATPSPPSMPPSLLAKLSAPWPRINFQPGGVAEIAPGARKRRGVLRPASSRFSSPNLGCKWLLKTAGRSHYMPIQASTDSAHARIVCGAGCLSQLAISAPCRPGKALAPRGRSSRSPLVAGCRAHSGV